MNEVSIAQSIISQALSPRLNLSFSPKSPDKTRLVDSQATYAHGQLEMDKFTVDEEPPSCEPPTTDTLHTNLSQLEATINASINATKTISDTNQDLTPKEDTPKTESITNSDNTQSAVMKSKWPVKPGVLVHVNSNHTLSPKNQARLQMQNRRNVDNVQMEANLGLLERNANNNDRDETKKTPPKAEYSKKMGKPRRHTQSIVSGLLKNFRKQSDNVHDSDSGKYKKINKSNKRALSLLSVQQERPAFPRSRIRALFQSDSPNVIVTEGGTTYTYTDFLSSYTHIHTPHTHIYILSKEEVRL